MTPKLVQITVEMIGEYQRLIKNDSSRRIRDDRVHWPQMPLSQVSNLVLNMQIPLDHSTH